MKYFSQTIALLAILFSTSCAKDSINNRIQRANKIAEKSGFQRNNVTAKSFKILTFSKITDYTKPLSIFIEGDGFAWKTRYIISQNPTPKNPIGLKLAAIDQSPNILYIARPCQYVDILQEKHCQNKFWSRSRFSDVVLKDINIVIDKFVQDYEFTKVNMYGYSGGGAIAVLIASRRNDVRSIRTVAANLNHKHLMKFHQLSPLSDSLDAIDVAQDVSKTWQYHLLGGKDKIVTNESSMSFINKAKEHNSEGVNFAIVKGATHRDYSWPKEWVKSFNEEKMETNNSKLAEVNKVEVKAPEETTKKEENNKVVDATKAVEEVKENKPVKTIIKRSRVYKLIKGVKTLF